MNEHAANPVLAPTYDPAVLARADSLAKDITHLLTFLPSEVTSAAPSSPIDGPLPPFSLPLFLAEVFSKPPAALATYLEHLRSLASSDISAPGLLAHSYVRYLGDLSGGQFISAKIQRAYNLQGPDGLRFYHFDLQNRASSDEESRADGRRRAGEVKNWFRKGLDEGVGEDEELKGGSSKYHFLATGLTFSDPDPRGQSRFRAQHLLVLSDPPATKETGRSRR